MDGYAGFAEYVAGHRAGLSRAAYLLTGDVYAAEDIVQDALVTAASRWRRIREGGDPDPLCASDPVHAAHRPPASTAVATFRQWMLAGCGRGDYDEIQCLQPLRFP